jgi:histone deacetylase complex subunit SAP18
MNRHNPTHEYKTSDCSPPLFPQNELQLYTWSDATLRELTDLLKSTVGEARNNKNARLEFTVVALDQNTKYASRDVGKVSLSRNGPDDEKTLSDLRFDIGDFLDVAIFLPTAHGRQRERYQ